MKTFILGRLKMFAGIVAPLVTAALIKGAETATGFDIPNEWELAAIAAVTGLFVERTPNITQ